MPWMTRNIDPAKKWYCIVSVCAISQFPRLFAMMTQRLMRKKREMKMVNNRLPRVFCSSVAGRSMMRYRLIINRMVVVRMIEKMVTPKA